MPAHDMLMPLIYNKDKNKVKTLTPWQVSISRRSDGKNAAGVSVPTLITVVICLQASSQWLLLQAWMAVAMQACMAFTLQA